MNLKNRVNAIPICDYNNLCTVHKEEAYQEQQLTDKEKRVLYKYFYEGIPLAKIAEEMGLEKKEVSKIKRLAVRKARNINYCQK